jgi:hypothetical protein
MVAVFLSVTCLNGFAQPMPVFIRITCIPEVYVLRFEYVWFVDPVAFSDEESDDKLIQQRILVWEKNGFHLPTNLDYECRLSDAVYRIKATQPPPRGTGACGGAPPITLSLTRDNQEVLKEVVFGEDCNERPTVTNVTVVDTPPDWGEHSITFCIDSAGGAPKSPLIWSMLPLGWDGAVPALPIDQKKVESYVKRGQ